MTLITLSAFWKGILIGFCLGYCFALVTLGLPAARPAGETGFTATCRG